VCDHHRVFTKSRSRNSSSISPTARWVETSRAEVISSAMSNDGLSSVEMIITTRCFIPPEELDRVPLEDVRVEPDQLDPALKLGKCGLVVEAPRLQQLGHHPADPARGVERAHRVLGDDRDLLEAEIRASPFASEIGSSLPSSSTWPPSWRMRTSMRTRLLPSVDLPQPDSPASP